MMPTTRTRIGERLPNSQRAPLTVVLCGLNSNTSRSTMPMHTTMTTTAIANIRTIVSTLWPLCVNITRWFRWCLTLPLWQRLRIEEHRGRNVLPR